MTPEQRTIDACRARGLVVTEGGRLPEPPPTPASRVHVLWIPGWRSATVNQLMRRTVQVRCRLARIDREIVAYYARKQSIPKATGKRRVALEIVLTGRQQESDADAPWKSTLDSLVSCGLLRGDKVQDVELGGVRYSRGGEAGTRVVLTDVEDMPT